MGDVRISIFWSCVWVFGQRESRTTHYDILPPRSAFTVLTDNSVSAVLAGFAPSAAVVTAALKVGEGGGMPYQLGGANCFSLMFLLYLIYPHLYPPPLLQCSPVIYLHFYPPGCPHRDSRTVENYLVHHPIFLAGE